MPDLPIRRMVLYKHGVGYFERRGALDGETLRLSFPREAMDDVLKSLVALDLGSGQVRGVEFETPDDRATKIARGSIHLSDERSLLDLLRDLRGRKVRLLVADTLPTPDAETIAEARTVEGLLIGVDVEDERRLRAPLVTLYLPDERAAQTFAVRSVQRLELLDERAAEDLTYFLRAAQSEEDRRVATVRLSPGAHDLLIGYVAPAPAWRVSYRLLVETPEPEAGAQPLASSPQSSVLLQGWGLFDNQLDEDLDQIELVMVAGMPVSFRYRLYEPHTPDRPFVADEERTVPGPIAYAAGAPPMAAPMMADAMAEMAPMAAAPMRRAKISAQAAENSVAPVGAGEDRGALFQYRVSQPVSVARGQSAMVPIVAQRLQGRKELLYNGQKLPKHPVASLRLQNATGLTLERGPATVIDEGDYAGEAVLPFTRAGGELIVPYAVELGISVREQHEVERRIGGLAIRDEFLVIQEWEVRKASYHLTNSLPASAAVTVEAAVLDGYELVETAAPSEHAQGNARWVVSCAPGAETAFTVRQRRSVSRREQVRGLSQRQLREFLRQRFLDETTVAALEGVLAIYAGIEESQKRVAQLEGERQKLYERQRQTQSSLAPLGNSDSEGKLRERYVALLSQLEDQLGGLAEQERALNETIVRLEDEARAALAALAGGPQT